MATPTEIQAQISRGWEFFSDLMEKDLGKRAGGCLTCGNSLTPCLYNILISLRDRIELGVYDDTTDKLYSDMMEIIGAGDPVYGPNVDAGPPIAINQPETEAQLNGTVTAGDNPISEIMWIQVSGPNQAEIVTPTSAVTQVTGLIPGTYVFKLSAIDTIGKVGADSTTVTVTQASVIAYFWNSDTPAVPTLEDILSSNSVSFVSGQPIVIPFVNEGVPKYSGIAYPMIEPIKTKWVDSDEFWNNGTIGTPGDLFAPYVQVSSLRVTVTEYPTQFDNSIRFQ